MVLQKKSQTIKALICIFRKSPHGWKSGRFEWIARGRGLMPSCRRIRRTLVLPKSALA